MIEPGLVVCGWSVDIESCFLVRRLQHGPTFPPAIATTLLVHKHLLHGSGVSRNRGDETVRLINQLIGSGAKNLGFRQGRLRLVTYRILPGYAPQAGARVKGAAFLAMAVGGDGRIRLVNHGCVSAPR